MILKKAFGAAVLAALAVAASGCTGDHRTYRVGDRTFVAGEPAPSSTQAAASGVDVAGRWTLASAAGGSCAVTLSGGPGAAEGSIKPEGGCPGKLYTGRKWSLQQGALLIQDHTGSQLAQLAMSSPTQFAGTAGGGQQLTLSR